MEKKCRRFWLQRDEDESGVSGTGIVAEGVIFTSGKAVLSWLTAMNSMVLFDSITLVDAIHGHGGKTKIVYEDD
jgi:hypothetical protein